MGSEKLRSIRRYHIRNSRALDVARWHYHFEDGTEKDVLSALAAYQNSDGGSGHGLEPDVRSPVSSPQATLVAVRILQELDFPELAGSMYRHMLEYLDAALLDQQRWPATVPEFNEAAHAPWWHHDETASVWGWNPTVELAAFVLVVGKDYPALHEKACDLVEEAFREFMEPTYEPERHELTNFARAGELLLKQQSDLVPSGFVNKMEKHLIKTVETEPAAYGRDDYIASPAIALNSPQSPYYPAIRQIADFYRDHLEQSVSPEGFWRIPWTWGEAEMSPDSVRDWRGVLIMEHMLYLHHFRPMDNK